MLITTARMRFAKGDSMDKKRKKKETEDWEDEEDWEEEEDWGDEEEEMEEDEES